MLATLRAFLRSGELCSPVCTRKLSWSWSVRGNDDQHHPRHYHRVRGEALLGTATATTTCMRQRQRRRQRQNPRVRVLSSSAMANKLQRQTHTDGEGRGARLAGLVAHLYHKRGHQRRIQSAGQQHTCTRALIRRRRRGISQGHVPHALLQLQMEKCSSPPQPACYTQTSSSRDIACARGTRDAARKMREP